MANLGSIALSFEGGAAKNQLLIRQCAPSALSPRYSGILPTPNNGKRSGTVTIDGVAMARVVVRLYWRESGALIEQQFTASDGTYAFTGLDPTALNQYLILALDPAGASPYNYTLVQDHLTAQVA